MSKLCNIIIISLSISWAHLPADSLHSPTPLSYFPLSKGPTLLTLFFCQSRRLTVRDLIAIAFSSGHTSENCQQPKSIICTQLSAIGRRPGVHKARHLSSFMFECHFAARFTEISRAFRWQGARLRESIWCRLLRWFWRDITLPVRLSSHYSSEDIIYRELLLEYLTLLSRSKSSQLLERLGFSPQHTQHTTSRISRTLHWYWWRYYLVKKPLFWFISQSLYYLLF